MGVIGRDMKSVKVIGISAVSGGGKTAVVRRLVEALGDAVAIHFDDYDGTNVHPADRQRWFADGGDYDAYATPEFIRHLEALKTGQSITHPIGGEAIEPSSYVVVDAPLGRAHSASGRFIDLMVFVDTPLDVAMARRTLRAIERVSESTAAEALRHIQLELSEYEARARPIYEHFQERVRAVSDLIVDGALAIDAVVERILAEIASRWTS